MLSLLYEQYFWSTEHVSLLTAPGQLGSDLQELKKALWMSHAFCGSGQ